MANIRKILIWQSFLGFAAVGLFGPIYAIFVQDIGGDILEAGIAYGIFSLVSGIFIFTFGRSEFFKTHLSQMVFTGMALLTIGDAGYLFVQNPLHLFIVQIILGVGLGIIEPSWDALFSINLDEKTAAHFWSTWAGTRDVATGIGALMGSAIAAAYSFQVLFIVMLMFNLAALVISIPLLKK